MSIADKLTTIADNEQKVYDAGKKAEYDAFWDSFQNYGNRTKYEYAFYGGGPKWRNIFYPKYDIRPTNANNMFQYSNLTIDLKNRLEECGVVLDFSKATTANSCFNYCYATHLPELNLTSISDIGMMFYSCSATVIDKLILKNDGSQKMRAIFQNYTALTDIVIEGVIGNDINVQWSTKLAHNSLMSIINALKDYSTTSGTTYTLTLGNDNLEKLSETEKEIVRSKGWTLA